MYKKLFSICAIFVVALLCAIVLFFSPQKTWNSVAGGGGFSIYGIENLGYGNPKQGVPLPFQETLKTVIRDLYTHTGVVTTGVLDMGGIESHVTIQLPDGSERIATFTEIVDINKKELSKAAWQNQFDSIIIIYSLQYNQVYIGWSDEKTFDSDVVSLLTDDEIKESENIFCDLSINIPGDRFLNGYDALISKIYDNENLKMPDSIHQLLKGTNAK